MNIKKVLTLGLCAVMALSLAACGGQSGNDTKPDQKNETISTTPADIQTAIKEALGDGWLCDAELDEETVLGYYGLDGEQIEAISAAESSNSSLNIDRVVIIQVKDGYAEDAVKALNDGFDQTAGYSRLYGFGVPKMLGTRLYQSGNFVALITAGASGDELPEEEAAKLSSGEYAKIDEAWKGIFGNIPTNQIVIPEEKETGGLMTDGSYDGESVPMVGG